MRKVIAAINMTLDGYCDHTAVDADDEIHNHYAELLRSVDIALYGRITYQLMEFWKGLVEKPTGEKSMDDFAIVMDQVQKIVFSNTLHSLDWESAKLADASIESVIVKLKQQAGGDILVGSRSLIIQMMNLNLIDELQLCIHPVLAGNGLPLFDKIDNRMMLVLTGTKKFKSGAIIHYFKPSRN